MGNFNMFMAIMACLGFWILFASIHLGFNVSEKLYVGIIAGALVMLVSYLFMGYYNE